MLDKHKREILKNIKDRDEKIVLAKALDKAIFSYKTNDVTFTDFLDLYKINTLKNIIDKNMAINCKHYGGYLDAERNILAFYPEFIEVSSTDYPLNILEINLNTNYANQFLIKTILVLF